MSNQITSQKLRKGSLVVATDETCDGIFGRVGKAIEIVERSNYGDYESMTVFKMNYNGQVYVIPTKNIRKATAEEKRRDPKNNYYWNNSSVSNYINLSKVYWVPKATQYKI